MRTPHHDIKIGANSVLGGLPRSGDDFQLDPRMLSPKRRHRRSRNESTKAVCRREPDQSAELISTRSCQRLNRSFNGLTRSYSLRSECCERPAGPFADKYPTAQRRFQRRDAPSNSRVVEPQLAGGHGKPAGTRD